MSADITDIAAALLADGHALVRVRTIAARVHYRRLLCGRPATRAEKRLLRAAYAQRRAVGVELAQRYRP